ncbi:rhizopine catabolism protein [Bradyrhizobium sp. SSBR45G]|uniref:fatty acid desaturase n=1 Tax=unclassified Bradyrhizobium TaxID=2631580 RepID=UPI002342A814|nr:MULTISPECIES: fatty acid desaturase [unclassified Bradyrhizobium]GLH80745.1 rhizopine catabolism protein [Bradyrhizobium sp. SSBR45G]GLH88217.1 rhizopine catabolism protein [Bradyrhizobium sp. SSBR45R]
MPTDEFAPRPKLLTPVTLQALCRRSNLQGALRALAHYGAIAAVGTLIGLIASAYGVPWALPLMLPQGVLVAFLFMAVHETAHKTAFDSRAPNIAVGTLSGFLIGLPYEYYCLFHWEHHRHTQDPERDPELIVGPKPRSETQLAIAYSGLVQVAGRLRLLLKHAITGEVTVPWVPAGRRATIVREARAYAAGYAVLLLGSLAMHSALLLWVWVLPLLLGQLILRPYLYAEHTGCDHAKSAFHNTRTTFTTRAVHWLTWNMPYHVEHHAYPAVPFHALPKLHEIVDGEIKHRGQGYIEVTRQTRAWFRAQWEGTKF